MEPTPPAGRQSLNQWITRSPFFLPSFTGCKESHPSYQDLSPWRASQSRALGVGGMAVRLLREHRCTETAQSGRRCLLSQKRRENRKAGYVSRGDERTVFWCCDIAFFPAWAGEIDVEAERADSLGLGVAIQSGLSLAWDSGTAVKAESRRILRGLVCRAKSSWRLKGKRNWEKLIQFGK